MYLQISLIKFILDKIKWLRTLEIKKKKYKKKMNNSWQYWKKIKNIEKLQRTCTVARTFCDIDGSMEPSIGWLSGIGSMCAL